MKEKLLMKFTDLIINCSLKLKSNCKLNTIFSVITPSKVSWLISLKKYSTRFNKSEIIESRRLSIRHKRSQKFRVFVNSSKKDKSDNNIKTIKSYSCSSSIRIMNIWVFIIFQITSKSQLQKLNTKIAKFESLPKIAITKEIKNTMPKNIYIIFFKKSLTKKIV